MKRLLLVVVLAGCSKTPVFAAENHVSEIVTAPASSAVVAPIEPASPSTPPPREDCAAPSRLVQLGTLHARASFSGELLATGDRKMFDPVTFASVPAPPIDTKIDRRGGASITPSKYRDVVNGRGLTSDTEAQDVVVDLATGDKIFATDTCMQARFADGWLSTTGRFFFCHTEEGRLQAWDLDSKSVAKDESWKIDESIVFTPGDTYAVSAPRPSWIEDEPTATGVQYFDVDTKKSKVVLDATLPLDSITHRPKTPDVPFDVQFCGNGDLFAATGDSEIAVFAGKDGSKLASAPSKSGGTISFSMSGKYLSQTRGTSTTVYRLDL